MAEQVKECKKCGVEKPRTSFYKDEKMSDGLRSECKDCKPRRSKEENARYMREYRANNPAYREAEKRRLRKRGTDQVGNR